MRPAICLMLLCSARATREVVRIERVPVIERIREEVKILVPIPVPAKPPTLKPKESERWA